MEHTGGRDLIVIGTSAGGLDVLSELTAQLPSDLPAAVCVVQHLPPQSPGTFARVLERESALPIGNAEDGEALEHGRVYVAPPRRHLLVEPEGRLRLWYGPRENRARPAIDPLFRSAASAYGPRVVGVVLSGALDDGTVGLKAIKRAGGAALVQQPEDASYPSMPQSALDYVTVDYNFPVAKMGALLERLTRTSVTPTSSSLNETPSPDDPMPSLSGNENAGPSEPTGSEKTGREDVTGMNAPGEPPREGDGGGGVPSGRKRPGGGQTGGRRTSAEAPNPGYAARGALAGEAGRMVGMACPECDGPLEELLPKAPRSYRCHEGHRFTAKSLLAGQDDAAERALWVALRTLDERHRMLRRMAADAREEERPRMAERYERRAEEAEGHTESLRALLRRIGEAPPRESV
jgi:two-component system chemotaxis response regulator CheB